MTTRTIFASIPSSDPNFKNFTFTNEEFSEQAKIEKDKSPYYGSSFYVKSHLPPLLGQIIIGVNAITVGKV